MVWGRFWVVRLVVGHSFVLNISSISIFMVSVICNNLGASVRKKNSVFTRNNAIFILNFVLSEIGTRVLILYTIFICEWFWWDLLDGVIWGRFVWCWVIWFWSWMIWSWVIRSWSIWCKSPQCVTNTTKH